MNFLSQCKVFLSGLILTAIGTTLLYLNETTWCYMAQPNCPENTSGLAVTLLVVAIGASFSGLAQGIALIVKDGESK